MGRRPRREEDDGDAESQESSSGETEDEEESDEDEDWDDPNWRHDKREHDKAMRKELKGLKQLVEEQSEALQDKKRLEAQVVRLEKKAVELEAVRETLEDTKRKQQASANDRDAARARLRETQDAHKAAEAEARRLCSEKEALKKTVSKLEKELEWDKLFRSGVEKKRDKLAKRVGQLEHELKSQTQYTAAAEQKFQSEAKDVERERAQRLIDVHKIKRAENERDEMRAVAESKTQVAAAALASEGHMKALVDPLRASLQRCEQLALEDAAHIAANEEEIVQLKDCRAQLDEQLADAQLELRTTRKRADQLATAMSALRAEVFRMTKAHPDMKAYLSDQSWGPLIHSMQLRSTAKTLGAAGGPQAPRTALEGGEGSPREQQQQQQEQHALASAHKFALFLDECAEQLEAEAKRPTLEERFSNARAAATTPPQEVANGKLGNKKQLKPLKPPPPGSLYVGHGLGLKKKLSC